MKITNTEDLRKLYPEPKGRTLKKELLELDKHCINFLSKSPFMVLSSVGKNGKMDASPRGGEAGFAKVLNSKQILLADAKGNNRLDSITNIVESGEVGSLFLIPGIDETLRINGTAEIRTDSKYLEFFKNEQNEPKTFILINIDTVFLHCAKALMRSDLWGPKFKVAPKDFPTMGQMIKDQIKGEEVPESREDMKDRYQSDL
ncbi:MAG: PPOX class probable FMN-dependent enzyme [Arenicella sp.]|jgi:PPOX class probable FMN-dependent enzyme